MTRVIQFTGVTLTGLLAGNELGMLIGSHPAGQALPLPAQIETEQTLTGRLAKIMPLYTSGTLLATIAAAVDRAGRPGFGLSVAAARATTAML